MDFYEYTDLGFNFKFLVVMVMGFDGLILTLLKCYVYEGRI